MKTMRDWKDELRDLVELIPKESYPNMFYSKLSDFIEQEIKKEREEIVEIVSKEFDRQSESCRQFGHEPILYLPDTKRIIINIIKNRV